MFTTQDYGKFVFYNQFVHDFIERLKWLFLSIDNRVHSDFRTCMDANYMRLCPQLIVE